MPHAFAAPIVLERGWLSSNSIVFASGSCTAIVDTGYCTHADQTSSLLHSALAGRSLDRLINTHLHSDHCGGNVKLQSQFPSVVTLIPPGHAHAVRNWDVQTLSYAPTGQSCPQFSFSDVLSVGSTIVLGDKDWEIHAAPGHDPQSIILFEPQSKTLISADALWEHGFGVVFPQLEGINAFDEVAATLDLIERLAPLSVIPGHGSRFTDVSSALSRARQRLVRFVQQPVSHAKHAAKVLLKFKLLELQTCTQESLWIWAQQTPYFHQLHQSFFDDAAFTEWLDSLLMELVRAQAAAVDGHIISNRN
jgi:glyoxylase-like metal-dependent hydrolase (beta-lactamase superfamily II)